jgi:hypothetical protein
MIKINDRLILGNGADRQIRTADLTLTKGALYQLSHISISQKWSGRRESNSQL